MRPHPAIRHWTGETLTLGRSVTLIRCGGHFPGGTVLHWRRDPGPSVLLSGDILQVVPDRRHVSFMYSYPQLHPAERARGAVHRGRGRTLCLRQHPRRLVGPEHHRRRAKAVSKSVARYLEAIA